MNVFFALKGSKLFIIICNLRFQNKKNKTKKNSKLHEVYKNGKRLEKSTHSVSLMFLLWLFVILLISHFVFRGGAVVLSAQVPDHCFSPTFYWGFGLISAL